MWGSGVFLGLKKAKLKPAKMPLAVRAPACQWHHTTAKAHPAQQHQQGNCYHFLRRCQHPAPPPVEKRSLYSATDSHPGGYGSNFAIKPSPLPMQLQRGKVCCCKGPPALQPDRKPNHWAQSSFSGKVTARPDVELGWCGVNHGRGGRECTGCTQCLCRQAVHRGLHIEGLCTVLIHREHRVHVQAQSLGSMPRVYGGGPCT